MNADVVAALWHANLERPAASRYAATTPEVLRWSRPFNEGKPYAEQVRPFNFLLWFHAKKPEEIALAEDFPLWDPRQRRLKPVAPFASDPRVVTEMRDRETEEPVPPEALRTYAEVLRLYPLHSESKFLDGAWTQSGPLRRRHVFADVVWNIGKEGDRFEEDSSLGAEDDPALAYGLSETDGAAAIETIRGAKDRFGFRAYRKAAGVSDNTIAAALDPARGVDDRTLLKLVGAANRLQSEAQKNDARAQIAIDWICTEAASRPIEAIARELGVDASNLGKVRVGKRPPTAQLAAAIGRAIQQRLADDE